MESTRKPASESVISRCVALRQELLFATRASAQQRPRGTSGALRTVAKKHCLPRIRMHVFVWLSAAGASHCACARSRVRSSATHRGVIDPSLRLQSQFALHAWPGGRLSSPAGVWRAESSNSCETLGLQPSGWALELVDDATASAAAGAPCCTDLGTTAAAGPTLPGLTCWQAIEDYKCASTAGIRRSMLGVLPARGDLQVPEHAAAL
jgi:hypothetical protein